MTLVPFGLRPDGRLIDAGMAERGKACNCVCPGCKRTLIARKGTVRVEHFGHEADTDCRRGAETALHMAAKQLVAEVPWLDLPQLSVTARRDDPEFGTFQATASYHDIKQWHFESAQAEVELESIRPDVVGVGAGGERYAVEIRVAHKVDKEKARYIRSMQLPCIEIDLRPLVGKLISFDELADHLQRDLASKTWIHHPRFGEYEAALLAGFDDWRTKRAAEILLFTRLADERQEDAARGQRRRDEVQRRNNEFRQRPLTEKWARLYDELGVTEQNWPRHLAVEVREGVDAFKVTKEMWQGALFSRFIFGCGKGDRVGQPVYSVPIMESWLAQRYGVRERSSAHAQSAIRLYLAYLAKCGFLEKLEGQYVVAHDGLLPPSARSHEAGVDEKPAPEPFRREPSDTDARHQAKPHRIAWRTVWPDEDRLRKWAHEYAASNMEPGFRPDDFAVALLCCADEPSAGATLRLLEAAGGNARHLHGLLKSMAVTEDSWRYLSGGELPPWQRA